MTVRIENAGQRRRTGQSEDDRKREIKAEPDWMEGGEFVALKRQQLAQTMANTPSEGSA